MSALSCQAQICDNRLSRPRRGRQGIRIASSRCHAVLEARRAKSRQRSPTMELSARNQLQGTVKEVKLGSIMAEVTVDVGGQDVVSAITRASVERLNLVAGDRVTVIIKSTEVMLGK